MEPWSIVKCSVCSEEYHLADVAKCKCGKKESEELFKKHLGEYNNEFKKA
jgi:hypothetical protein